MKLSAQVVADNLPESFEVRLLGTPREGLTLQRPELLERGWACALRAAFSALRAARLRCGGMSM